LDLTRLENDRGSISHAPLQQKLHSVVRGPETDQPDFSKFIDMNMLVMTGGKERTAKEFEQLLNAAGFKLLRVIPPDLPTAIVEAQPL